MIDGPKQIGCISAVALFLSHFINSAEWSCVSILNVLNLRGNCVSGKVLWF